MVVVTAVERRAALGLYRDMMRLARQQTSYNYREYARRRIRDAFRASANEAVAERRAEMRERGAAECRVLRRAVALQRLYPAPKLVVDSPQPTTKPTQ